MLGNRERREEFRNRVTSLDFLRLPELQQRNEIIQTVTSGRITEEDLDQIQSQLERNLRVVSLNVGFNVMSNFAQGSEAAFVERCQQFHNDTYGWFYNDGINFISSCANNSAMFLVNYNLFGLQEVNPYYQREFVERITNAGRDAGKNFVFYDNNYPGRPADNTIITGYDRNVMGQGLLITPVNSIFGNRDAIGVFQATYFPKRNLLFINVHAPNNQNVNLTYRLGIAFDEIRRHLVDSWPTINSRNLRIILAGNFNDCDGVLINQSNEGQFKIFDKELRLHVQTAERPMHRLAPRNAEHTCCYPEYKCYGDYIFDTSPLPLKFYYFGFPIDYNRRVDLYSNHDPVIMLELDDLGNKTLQGEIFRNEHDGEEHLSIIFKNLDQDMLYDIARLFLRKEGIPSNIVKPLSWGHGAFPHVSLNKALYPNLRNGTRVKVTLKDLQYWPIEQDAEGRWSSENRWVVITVVIQGGLKCPGTCHMSIGQQHISTNVREYRSIRGEYGSIQLL